MQAWHAEQEVPQAGEYVVPAKDILGERRLLHQGRLRRECSLQWEKAQLGNVRVGMSPEQRTPH